MPPVRKPGPKSKTRFSPRTQPPKPIAGDLGDTDTSVSNEEVETSHEESFRSPAIDKNVTDYSLNFTSIQQGTPRTPRVQSGPTATSTRLRGGLNLRPRQKSPTIAEASTTRDAAAKKQAPSKKNRRKQKHPQILNFMREHRALVASDKFMIPRLPFGRLVRQIIMELSSYVTHISKTALEALQSATEAYVQHRLEDANLMALHARRVTLLVRDMELISLLRSRDN